MWNGYCPGLSSVEHFSNGSRYVLFIRVFLPLFFHLKKINLQGSIEDPVTKREWKSSKNMTSEELGIIAATAKKVNKNHKNK